MYNALAAFSVNAAHFSPKYNYQYYKESTPKKVLRRIQADFWLMVNEAFEYEDKDSTVNASNVEFLEQKMKKDFEAAQSSITHAGSSITIGYPEYSLSIVFDGFDEQFYTKILDRLLDDGAIEEYFDLIMEKKTYSSEDLTEKEIQLIDLLDKVKLSKNHAAMKNEIDIIVNMVCEDVLNEEM